MGAKTAVKLRNRGAAYKCDLCGRKLMTPDALAVHQRTAHNIITRRTKPKQLIKSVKSTKVEGKEKHVTKSITPLKNTPKISDKKVKSEPVRKKEENVTKDEANRESKPEKKKKPVEFECPKCCRVFLTYFPALKHIQKFHCVNRQGNKVPPNSPSLIQPIRIELCLKCKRKVKSISTHVCDNTVKGKSEDQVFICTACEEWFPNLKSFDIHVLSLHGDEVESMFFPTSIEFTKWKLEMEEQTNTSYAILDNYDSKKYYHCNTATDNNEKVDNNTYFCPSTIVIQEFTKGIQVHFYKQHFKHNFVDYTLTDKYKKYSITSFLKRSEEYNSLPNLEFYDNDMYLQFKTLMEGIVVDAAKINIATLKILIGKALDMTSTLTNYDEEVDESSLEVRNPNQNMNDTEISKALEDNNMNTGKRKNNYKSEIGADIKKTKFDSLNEDNLDASSPKILNSFSLADNIDAMNELNEDENKPMKNLIDKIKSEDKESKTVKQLKDNDLSPSSFNDSYRDFVVKNFPSKDAEVKTKKVGRPVVKTKIGQFKPNLLSKSPVKLEAKKIELNTSNRSSIDRPKVDFEYEVKEQEGGCNILILKI